MTVPVHGLPPLLHEGLTVAVVPPPLKEKRWRTVLSVTDDGRQGSLVHLSGCDGIPAAESISGCMLLARIDDLPDDYLLHDADALIGREVCDKEHGSLGTITAMLSGVAQDVWVIDGPYGEVMLPVVEEFIEEVPAIGAILVVVPEGTLQTEGE